MSGCANLELVTQMNKMTDQQLTQLYRRMTRDTGPGDMDGAQLHGYLQGSLTDAGRDEVLAQVAGSHATADATRLLIALEADSTQLAAQVDALSTQQLAVAAHSRGRSHRIARGRRAARIGAGWLSVAACLVAVLGIWNMDPRGGDASDPQVAQPATEAPDVIFVSNDRIFASTTESSAVTVQDRLFSSRFAGG